MPGFYDLVDVLVCIVVWNSSTRLFFFYLQDTWCILGPIEKHLHFELQCESMSCHRRDTGWS